ncbi:hypothetical protein, partial [uncultured Alteromonas sp.]|uniref:hypothetical protein n=1 Tax=uncultured Alteromonas sp. TaxID=179113 RepID=UPI0030DB81BC
FADRLNEKRLPQSSASRTEQPYSESSRESIDKERTVSIANLNFFSQESQSIGFYILHFWLLKTKKYPRADSQDSHRS